MEQNAWEFALSQLMLGKQMVKVFSLYFTFLKDQTNKHRKALTTDMLVYC